VNLQNTFAAAARQWLCCRRSGAAEGRLRLAQKLSAEAATIHVVWGMCRLELSFLAFIPLPASFLPLPEPFCAMAKSLFAMEMRLRQLEKPFPQLRKRFLRLEKSFPQLEKWHFQREKRPPARRMRRLAGRKSGEQRRAGEGGTSHRQRRHSVRKTPQHRPKIPFPNARTAQILVLHCHFWCFSRLTPAQPGKTLFY
jgi:hypothetical protein